MNSVLIEQMKMDISKISPIRTNEEMISNPAEQLTKIFSILLNGNNSIWAIYSNPPWSMPRIMKKMRFVMQRMYLKEDVYEKNDNVPPVTWTTLEVVKD